MTPTKDQQAQEYAEKKFPELLLTIEKAPWPKTREILAKAYTDGYTAAEQSMWRSVEEELPEVPNSKKMIRVFAWIGDEPLVCWYTCHGRFITTLAAKERCSYNYAAQIKVHLPSEREDVTEMVTHWMQITPPSLPDTNTEKK